MTARDEALALLRERFPEPWAIEVVRLDSSCFVARAGTEPAERGPNPVRVYAEGDTAISAARACIAAWDDATKAEARVAVLAAECRAWREREKFYAVGNVSVQWGQATHAVSVARAATDANGGLS